MPGLARIPESDALAHEEEISGPTAHKRLRDLVPCGKPNNDLSDKPSPTIFGFRRQEPAAANRAVKDFFDALSTPCVVHCVKSAVLHVFWPAGWLRESKRCVSIGKSVLCLCLYMYLFLY